MAKCSKCSSRKGKRPCPALAGNICSTCCGEHRQRDIACPTDCPYLGGEDYQRIRRRDRSQSRGRALINALSQQFGEDGPEKQFVSALITEIYAYSAQNRATDDAEVSTAIDDLHGLLGKIFVAGSAPGPLTLFLQRRAETVPALGTSRLLSSDGRIRTLKTFGNFLEETIQRRKRDPSLPSFMTLLHGLFDPLDLEQDLGYVWDTAGQESDGPKPTYERRSSGLIVPPTMG